LLVIVEGHVPWIFGNHDILEALALGQDVVAEANSLAHADNVKVVGKEVQVDGGLDKGIVALESHLTWARNGADEIDDDGDMVALLGGWEVPLEGRAEHADKVELQMRLALREEGILSAISGIPLLAERILLKVIINSREANELKETRGLRTGPILFVRLSCNAKL